MLPRLVAPPEVEPVSVTEAKAHLRIEDAFDDAYILALITAARQYVEKVCWRGLVTQTLELVLERFPCGALELTGGELQSIASVQYVAGDGALTTVPEADYVADTTTTPGCLRLAYGQSWPTARSQWDAVRIRYVVGTEADAVPQPIRQAILLLVSQMYEHRTPEILGTVVARIEFAVDALLSPYRLVRY